MISRRRGKSSKDDIFDDIFKEMGFGGFRDIFNAIFEGREVSNADFMKILDDDNKARFQKELDNDAAKKKDTRETKNEQFQGVSDHDLSTPKIGQNGIPSPLSKSVAKAITSPKGPVFTSVSQLTSYLKVDRIQADINALELDWPIFALKELGANCYDFFKVRYPNAPKESRKIAFRVGVDHAGILRMNVRNSNVDNVEVFKNLDEIFNFKIWGSEKRNQHNMTQGSLGDFLKRVLGMGYASWTSANDDDGENSLQNNKQWPEPVILRFNKKEYRVFLIVEDGPNPYPKIEGPFPYEHASDYTEVEIALPLKHYLPDPSEQKLLLDRLEQFYSTYKMAQRIIDFSFTNEGVAK